MFNSLYRVLSVAIHSCEPRGGGWGYKFNTHEPRVLQVATHVVINNPLHWSIFVNKVSINASAKDPGNISLTLATQLSCRQARVECFSQIIYCLQFHVSLSFDTYGPMDLCYLETDATRVRILWRSYRNPDNLSMLAQI